MPTSIETLRQGLAVELGQSPFLSLIPDQRIQGTLQLMGRTDGAPVTGDVAREVCERTFSAAVVEGSISRLGNQYVLGLRAANCRSGEMLDDEQIQAAKKRRCSERGESVGSQSSERRPANPARWLKNMRLRS